jgi:hypothetical protein
LIRFCNSICKILSTGPVVILMGIALVVESEVRSGSGRGMDPIFLAENPRAAIERYLGLALVFLGVWYIRQSIIDSDDD